jgi:hypothetical protein
VVNAPILVGIVTCPIVVSSLRPTTNDTRRSYCSASHNHHQEVAMLALTLSSSFLSHSGASSVDV